MNLQSKMVSYNKEVLEELKTLIKKFVWLESDQAITKNVNNPLSSRLTGWHYNWLNIAKDDLDAYHWLEDKERVIVKFCKRKDCEHFQDQE